jgi:hypothetical protein
MHLGLRSRQPVRLYALLVFGCSLALSGRAAEIPPEYTDAVHKAEAEGLSLYQAYEKGPGQSTDEVAAAKSRLTELCDFSYVPVKLKEGDHDVIFFLAEGPQKTDIVIGRHFRVAGTTVEPSSKSCLSLGTPKPNMAALFVTHLLSATPTLFHVYLTLRHKAGLFVRTNAGTWLVDNGTIKLMDPPRPAPAK